MSNRSLVRIDFNSPIAADSNVTGHELEHNAVISRIELRIRGKGVSTCDIYRTYMVINYYHQNIALTSVLSRVDEVLQDFTREGKIFPEPGIVEPFWTLSKNDRRKLPNNFTTLKVHFGANLIRFPIVPGTTGKFDLNDFTKKTTLVVESLTDIDGIHSCNLGLQDFTITINTDIIGELEAINHIAHVLQSYADRKPPVANYEPNFFPSVTKERPLKLRVERKAK
jgi:hypothetical protein